MPLELDIEVLRQLFDYDHLSGVVVRKELSPRMRSRNAGHHDHGYLREEISGRRYYVHRIVWALHYGRWPALPIDHINGDKRDNRISNLREATDALNRQNQRQAHRDNKTGLQGVVRSSSGRFTASVRANGSKHHLGSFDTPELAHAAYLEAKRNLHEGNTL